ncbi:hypothetical protein FIV06_20665 [Labrenzia sp. THAF191b]|nr:hypothetical protein FIV06_20665 [Labrenzia sp. THAF191b]QFT06167.1 hypothetical protein FIV05_20660 [Labrenzia sp. THAF191a]QFT17711.1 hypothetical protein FIV03_20675 [Labrenzia sp. THAF187b]
MLITIMDMVITSITATILTTHMTTITEVSPDIITGRRTICILMFMGPRMRTGPKNCRHLR